MSTALADLMAVNERFARSANLERDIDTPDALGGYVLTARAADMVRRVASAAAHRTGGAWAVTGPYGAGKSSLALLLDAAVGPPGHPRDHAWRLIGAADPATLENAASHSARRPTGTSPGHRHRRQRTHQRDYPTRPARCATSQQHRATDLPRRLAAGGDRPAGHRDEHGVTTAADAHRRRVRQNPRGGEHDHRQ